MELNIARALDERGKGLWLTLDRLPLIFVITMLFPELSDKKEAPAGVSRSN